MPIPQAVVRPYRVIENQPLADGVFRLLLEAQDSANLIPAFKAGQWVGLGLLNPDGSEWARAGYSIVNAPSTGTQRIELGLKLAGDFTTRAHRLVPGDAVTLQGPWGVFTFRADMPRVVMFAGGIGVTPFISMIREASASSLPVDLILFYSNRTCAETAYLDELYAMAQKNPRLRLIEVCTREPHADGDKESRRVDAQMLDAVIQEYAVGEYLLCGPREFMDAIKALLVAKGVDPKRIRKELFS